MTSAAARKKPALVRINARLDARRAGKLQELARATGNSVSDVIREAIDYYHASHPRGTQRGRAALRKLVGSARGPSDLSQQYKRYLAEDLAGKHGNR
jgi:hypothetical protein